MTVKELIKELQKMPPDAIVRAEATHSENDDHGIAVRPVAMVYQWRGKCPCDPGYVNVSD